MMAQCCPVYNRAVPNSTLITNRQGSVSIDMQRTIVLDVCTATNDDRSVIPSYDSVIPDVRTLLYGDIADDHCTGGDKYVFGDGRHNTLIWQDRHDCSFFHWLCAARHRWLRSHRREFLFYFRLHLNRHAFYRPDNLIQ